MKLKKTFSGVVITTTLLFLISACSSYNSSEVLVTSKAGDNFTEQENLSFKKGKATGPAILVDLSEKRQTIDGIGSSLTESSAFVLASISPGKKKVVLEKLFGESGANFPITRTHIGSCDFSVEGRYSYAEIEGDSALENFTLDPDREGFPKEKYSTVEDEDYDLLPLIKEVVAIKNTQEDKEFRIVASPWTAPAWMKDNNAYFGNGTGGSLKPENYPIFADYFIKYFQAMREEGIEVWGITPVNEPEGNNGSWESMHFNPAGEAEFVGSFLGPAIEHSDFSHVRVFGFDQNRPELYHWAEGLMENEKCAEYLDGFAIHWYASTFRVFEEILDSVQKMYPEKTILHTEGCIDNLGVAAGDWAEDPEGWTEEGWFMDDDWWWEKNATDWGYKVPWGNDLHAMYSPVHRYARNIIVSINNWMTGFIDWNVVLDKNGGPNHVGNFCGAPVMIDTETDEVHYTPVFHILKHLSRTIRPGDTALHATIPADLEDIVYACATVNQYNEIVISLLNVADDPREFSLQIGNYFSSLEINGNTLQTVIVELPGN